MNVSRYSHIWVRGGEVNVKLGYKTKVPRTLADKKFKKMPRDILLTECSYTKYWIDDVIRTA